MGSSVRIDQLTGEVMKGLREYAGLAAEDLKNAVKSAGKTVRKEISNNAPRKTGTYAESWTTTMISESANSLSVVVHSSNRYQLAHLLEFGHAKRGGGRVPGKAHIAPAEQKGIERLTQEIERSLGLE